MDYIRYSILGAIQGLTEFLPVSSSGHLAIFKNILGGEFLDFGLTYDILLHLATLLAVFVVYYKDIWGLIVGFFTLVRDIFRGKVDLKANPDQKLILLLIVASIPAAAVGFLLGDFIEDIFSRYFILVGFALIITAFELIAADKVSEGNLDKENLPLKKAIIPGLFQGFAILPGISRSGSTITGALLAGFNKEFAVKFSFLMSIPVILGSALFDIIDIIKGEGVALAVGPAIAGAIVAAIVGYISIKFMIKLVSGSKYHYFSYYCLAVGLFVIVWQIFFI